MDVIVDSSVWIDVLAGTTIAAVESAIADGTVVLTPIVVAELFSGDLTRDQSAKVGELLQDFELHDADLGHWMRSANCGEEWPPEA